MRMQPNNFSVFESFDLTGGAKSGRNRRQPNAGQNRDVDMRASCFGTQHIGVMRQAAIGIMIVRNN